MAIYTTNDFSMLNAKPLDTKRVMTYNQWDADDNAGLSYPGQLYYDPNSGWFRALGKDIDGDSSEERQIFGVGIDGLYIGNGGVFMTYGAPEICITSSNVNPNIYMTSDAKFINYGVTGIDYNDGPNDSMAISFSSRTIVFGNSSQITSNTNNKVIAMYGTGLKTNNPTINQFIIGQYNVNDTDASFIIGRGTSDNSRENILSIHSYDNEIIVNKSASMYLDRYDTIVDLFAYENMLYTSTPTVDRYDSYEYGTESLYKMPTSCMCDKLIVKVTEAYQSSELLHIWTKSATGSKKYIVQNYPIGKLSVGDMAIEQPISDIDSDAYIYFSITGGDYSDYEDYINHQYIGDFQGKSTVYIHVVRPHGILF